jgi:acyl carrier protein
MNTTLERLTEIVRYVVPDVSGDIAPAHELTNDLDIDSLSLVEILVQVEKRFQISIEDNEIPKVETVQDILDIIDNQQ